jgi:hypothetical protein
LADERRYRDDEGITNVKEKETILDQRFHYFVGIDWGTQTHCVVLLDGEGRAIEQYYVTHSGDGLVTLVEKLQHRTACDPAKVAIAIEVAWGALVETWSRKASPYFDKPKASGPISGSAHGSWSKG